MALVLIDESVLQQLAPAIRSKTGGTERLQPAEMPAAVSSIQTGGTGTDTSDATVTNGWQILVPRGGSSGFTAYSNGVKYTGSTPNAQDVNSGLIDCYQYYIDVTEPIDGVIDIGTHVDEETAWFGPGDVVHTRVKSEQLAPFVSGWTKVAEKTISANTTGTSATNLTTLTVPGLFAAERVLVRITADSGRRAGYFYQHEDYFRNYQNENGTTTTLTYGARIGLMVNSSGNLVEYVGATTTAYGVYAYSITSAGVLQIRTRYNANYSGTINDEFLIEVFTYSMPT